jgi:TolB-like protein
VRSYRILDEKQDGDTYRIKIQATVAPGSPVKSLAYLCKRLKEARNPSFAISSDDLVMKNALQSELLSLGLRVIEPSEKLPANSEGSDPQTPSKAGISAADIMISGDSEVEPLGEPVQGSGIFAARASADLSVTDSASGASLPMIGVSMSHPVTATSQLHAERESVKAVAVLWAQRNLPIIIDALLDNSKTGSRGAGGIGDFKPSNTNRQAPTSDHSTAPFVSGAGSGGSDSADDDGPRIVVDSSVLDQLAKKLKADVVGNAEFAPLPVETAVAKFKLIGTHNRAVADDVQEDLSTALTKTQAFDLAERGQLDKVLAELKIQNSGLIDSSTARKLGNLIGVKVILIGSISDRKDRIVINARLINTETGRVHVAETVTMEKDDECEPEVLHAGR